MDYYVGYVMPLGSEDEVRRNGLQHIDLDGVATPRSIGHKGQVGSDPNFSDSAPHDAICVKVEGSQVFMKCACGLEWNFNPDEKIKTLDIPLNPDQKDLGKIKEKWIFPGSETPEIKTLPIPENPLNWRTR